MAKPASIVINAGIVQRMSNDAAFLAQFPFLRRANNAAPVKSCCNKKKAAANAQGLAIVMRTLAGMPQAEINTLLRMLNAKSAKVQWSNDGKTIQTKLLTAMD